MNGFKQLLNKAIKPDMILDEVLMYCNAIGYFRLLHFIYPDYFVTKTHGLWMLIEGGRWIYSETECVYQYHLIKEWHHFNKQMPAPIKQANKIITSMIV